MENKYFESFVKLENIEIELACIKVSENIPYVGYGLENKLIFKSNNGNYDIRIFQEISLGVVNFVNNELKYLVDYRGFRLVLYEVSENDFIKLGLELNLDNLIDEIFLEVE